MHSSHRVVQSDCSALHVLLCIGLFIPQSLTLFLMACFDLRRKLFVASGLPRSVSAGALISKGLVLYAADPVPRLTFLKIDLPFIARHGRRFLCILPFIHLLFHFVIVHVRLSFFWPLIQLSFHSSLGTWFIGYLAQDVFHRNPCSVDYIFN